MRQRRGRRERTDQSGAQGAVQPGAQGAVQPGAQGATQPGAPGADRPFGGPGPASQAEPTTWPDAAVPPGTDGFGSQRPGGAGYGAPPAFLPSQPVPRLRFDPSPGGDWQRHEFGPRQRYDDQRPSYGP